MTWKQILSALFTTFLLLTTLGLLTVSAPITFPLVGGAALVSAAYVCGLFGVVQLLFGVKQLYKLFPSPRQAPQEPQSQEPQSQEPQPQAPLEPQPQEPVDDFQNGFQMGEDLPDQPRPLPRPFVPLFRQANPTGELLGSTAFPFPHGPRRDSRFL